MGHRKVYKLLSSNKIMVKRSLGTIVNDGLVGLLAGIGGAKVVEFGRNVGEIINKNYGSDLQKIGGNVLSGIVEYGPVAILGGLSVYGLYLAVKGVDNISLGKQIVKDEKLIYKMQKEAQGAQEDITESQEYIQQIQKDSEKIQKRMKAVEGTLYRRSAAETE